MFTGHQPRASPEKNFDRHFSSNMMHQMHGQGQQNFSNPYVSKGGVFPGNQSYAPTYHPMPVNPTNAYYHSTSPGVIPSYGVYAPNPMYPQHYLHRTVTPMQHPMKAQSTNMVHKPESLSSNELLSWKQNFSMHHGAPGLVKQNLVAEPVSGRLVRPKQLSSPLIPNTLHGLHHPELDRQSDSNLAQGIQSAKEVTPGVKEEVRAGLMPSPNIPASQPTSQKQIQAEDAKDSPSTKTTDVAKKSKTKNKGKKNEKRKRERLSGTLKFFDEARNYGFFVVDQDEQDMFVHYDDLKKTGIPKDLLSTCRNRYSMHFTFHVFEYAGKQKNSKKAVDIKLVSIYKIDPENETEIPEPVLLAKDLDPSVELTEKTLSNFFNS